MADDSITGTFKIAFPQDLLAEAGRVKAVKKDALRVEGWRSSWMSRLAELLIGKD